MAMPKVVEADTGDALDASGDLRELVRQARGQHWLAIRAGTDQSVAVETHPEFQQLFLPLAP